MDIRHAVWFMGLSAMLLSSVAQARVYRCTDADGKVSYSQLPCPVDQQAAEMRGVGGFKEHNRELCGEARDFSAQVFGEMNGGIEPGAVIDRHGGINNINAATLSVINFTASLRFNKDITPQQAGALSFSRCLGGGFGELRAGDLPRPEADVPAGSDATTE